MVSVGDTVFVVKDCLSWGFVFKRTVKAIQDNNLLELKFNDWGYFRLGEDCFETEHQALEAAEKLKLERIEDLEKQLAKTKSLEFKIY